MEFNTVDFIIFTMVYIISGVLLTALAFGIYRVIRVQENILAMMVAVASLAIALWTYTII